MSLAAIITQLAAIQTNISGVKHAHDNAPESINEYPCFVNLADAGNIQRSPGSVRNMTHQIKMQLYVTKAILMSAEAELRPYLESTLNAFDAKITLNGAAQWSGITSYKYGALTYAGQQYLGISFNIEVLERNIVTLA